MERAAVVTCEVGEGGVMDKGGIEERMGRLLGEKVEARFDRFWWELSLGNGVAWNMVEDDFVYSDEELVEKFVGPIRDCIARLARQVDSNAV
jgi:hypothetical protein